ncbi:MAG TPA: VTT domain-containing protein [Caulobacteraceae bacterium]|nr:VTT domain-containing protein [Caulobacteraceae bacterium]
MLQRLVAFLRRFGPAMLVAAGIVVAVASGAAGRLSLHELRERREVLAALTQAHPVLSALAFLGAYAAVVALSIPATVPMTLAGGLLFGPWVGGLVCAAAATLGGAILFLVCRTAAGDVLRRYAGPRIARIGDEVRRDAFFYILTIRLIPVMPFGVSTIALAFLEIPLAVFTAATFLGILPLSLIYANIGAGLRQAFMSHKHLNLHSFIELRLVLSLVALGLVALAPVVVRRLRRRDRA